MTRFPKAFSYLTVAVFFCLCPLLLSGQDNMKNDQSGMGQHTMSNHQMVTVTGCLKKGSEEGGYYITGKDGKTWELSSKTVNIAEHLNHTVTVAGHEMPGSKADEAKNEKSEKSEAGDNKYADLKVTKLEMVSTSCSQ